MNTSSILNIIKVKNKSLDFAYYSTSLPPPPAASSRLHPLLYEDFDTPDESELCEYSSQPLLPIKLDHSGGGGALSGNNNNNNLTVSAVIVTRNDGYGGHLTERATISIRSMLNVYDELVVVDMNSPQGKLPTITELPDDIQSDLRLTSVVVSAELCSKHLGRPCEDRMYEVLARQIGVDTAKSDVIISTNIDIIPLRRDSLHQIIMTMMPTWKHAVIIRRKNINLVDANDYVELTQRTSTAQTTSIIGVDRCTSMDNIVHGPQGKSAWDHGSIIPNCGDFQMAHRQLWNRAKGFRWHKDLVGRGGGDSVLLMSWMNAGAVIQLPKRKTAVYHINHGRTQVGEMTWNSFGPNVTLKIDETDGKYRFFWNDQPL